MSASIYQFLSTLALLKAVKIALDAVVLPEPYTTMGKAFEEVRVYAHNNIGQALQDLQVVSDRVALVIPAGFTHRNDNKDQVLTSRRTLEIVVLIADRVIGGSDNEAAMGGKDNPGMVYLTELAITALVNAGDFGLGANVCLEPTNGQPIMLPFQDKNFGDQVFAREAWGQTYSTPAGEMRLDRGRQTAARTGAARRIRQHQSFLIFMPLFLKSQDDITALINGSDYASIDMAVKVEIAQHFELMPASVREAALAIIVTTLPTDQAAFAQALFTTVDPPGGSGTAVPNVPTGGSDFVADIAAIRALPSASLPLGTVRGATRDNGQMGLWRLVASTAADAAPGIVRGGDFDSSTNPRVWKEQL